MIPSLENTERRCNEMVVLSKELYLLANAEKISATTDPTSCDTSIRVYIESFLLSLFPGRDLINFLENPVFSKIINSITISVLQSLVNANYYTMGC